MALLKINSKWYSFDSNTEPQTMVSIKNSYIQKEKDYIFGYVVYNETIYPLVGLSQNSKDTALLIKIRGSYLVLVIDDISFDDNEKSEPLSDLLKEKFNV